MSSMAALMRAACLASSLEKRSPPLAALAETALAALSNVLVMAGKWRRANRTRGKNIFSRSSRSASSVA